MSDTSGSAADNAFDYAAVYDAYWRRPDRKGQSSFGDARQLCQEVIRVFGLGSVLDVGCGHGELVRALSAACLVARGIDVSDVVIAEARRAIAPVLFDVGSILNLPFPDNTFDIVTCTDCLEHLAPADIPRALAELRRVCKQGVYLRIATSPDRDGQWRLTIENREWWESRCLEAGFRRHARQFQILDYAQMEHQSDQCVIVLEKIPTALLQIHPLDSLRESRMLHMDMAREAGRRSDAHIIRYFEAAKHVRPGDRVLDAACGLGYGAQILAANSRCSNVLGVDGSESAVAYAKASYGDGSRIDFRHGLLPQIIETLDPGSIDFIASFETLEHLENPDAFLVACRRVLTPGGRIMLSVPNDWTEEDGRDPNPHHFHVYDWARFEAEISRYFLLERRLAMTASRHKVGGRWAAHGRHWAELPDGVSPGPSEWCLGLAMRSPLEVSGQLFIERSVTMAGLKPISRETDFASQYANPWIVPSLISIGLRTEDERVRAELARQIADSGKGGADEAAALCLLGYLLLNAGPSAGDVQEFLQRVAMHVSAGEAQDASSIAVRWSVSLTFLTGQLKLRIGDVDGAAQAFERCAVARFERYSRLLASKTVQAAYQRGLIALARGEDRTVAREWFARGVETAQMATGGDWASDFGSLDRLPPFVVREIADVVQHGARCAVAASLLLELLHPAQVLDEIGPTQQERLAALIREREAMRAHLDALFDGNVWLKGQVENWKARAEGNESQIQELRKFLEQLTEGNNWLEDQVAAWQAQERRTAATLVEAIAAIARLSAKGA